MEIAVSSEIRLTELLHSMGICAEAVLVTVNDELAPETATAKKGDKVEIIFYKHVPPLLSQQNLRGHWKKAKHRKSCDRCKSKPVAYLPNFRSHLCRKHFLNLFEKTVKKTVRAHRMLNKNERIGIGVSGGKDSFALLHVLSRIRKSLPFELFALTIDEGIPGYRDKTIENACKRCKELEVKQHLYSFQEECGTTIMDIAKKKENLCSYCGVLRRRILNSKARELKLDKIAIAHNLDDIAQTAMLNMIRNEPLRLARFNSPLVADSRMVPRIRPLRDIREKEIATYAFLMGHEFNSLCCPYSKNSLRRAVRHELNFLEDQYPGTKSRIASGFDTLQDMVHKSIQKENLSMKSCSECGEPSSANLCMGCKMLKEII